MSNGIAIFLFQFVIGFDSKTQWADSEDDSRDTARYGMELDTGKHGNKEK
jgi:hypothetical protein